MRREMRIFMAALVVILTSGLSACVAPQSVTAGAASDQRSNPTPTSSPLPVQSPTDEAPTPSVTPSGVHTLNAAASTAENAVPINTGTPDALPNDTRIVINAPAYRMDIFEKGRLIKTYRIG